MLTASTLKGFTIAATDGAVGTVSDVLFDDTSWMVRWLVVDTGTWLSGRKVLLPPSVLGHADTAAKSFPVRLTRAEIEASPERDTQKPVSRQFETSIYDYYGWSPYWGTGFYMGGYGLMAAGRWRCGRTPRCGAVPRTWPGGQRQSAEPHLRSAEAVTSYHIHATDGEIGHLSDILVEEADFSIRYLVVDTSNWWAGHKVVCLAAFGARDRLDRAAGPSRPRPADGQGQPALRPGPAGRPRLREARRRPLYRAGPVPGDKAAESRVR